TTADFQNDFRAPDHGPALSGAARRAGRSARGAAPSFHGYDDGQGVSRRGRGQQIRDQSGERRGARSAGEGGLPDASGGREKSLAGGAVGHCLCSPPPAKGGRNYFPGVQNNRVAERNSGNNSPSSDGGQATAKAQWNTT